VNAGLTKRIFPVTYDRVMMGDLQAEGGLLMDEILPIAIPLAALAAVAAIVRPARERVVPVAKAVGRAGAMVGGATVAGGRVIVDAAARGEGPAEGQQPERTESASAPRARRRTTTSTAR
jgi:hypothetical protein